MVTFGLEENLGQFLIYAGAFLGNFGVTMLPFWKEQLRYKEFDIKIIFDHKFLATALISGITSIAIVTAAYEMILSEVTAMGNITAILAFLASIALGAGLNKGFNAFVPSPNSEAKEKVAELQAEAIIEAYEKNKRIETIGKIDNEVGALLESDVNEGGGVTPKL